MKKQDFIGLLRDAGWKGVDDTLGLKINDVWVEIFPHSAEIQDELDEMESSLGDANDRAEKLEAELGDANGKIEELESEADK